MKKLLLLLLALFIVSCQNYERINNMKKALNKYILETEGFDIDGDPLKIYGEHMDSLKVSYLYHLMGVNSDGDSVMKFSNRFFVFNKLDLKFREERALRENKEYVHYMDLKMKAVRDSLFIVENERKVIGDILFGMNEGVVLEKIENFKNESKKKIDRTGYNSFEYFIGEFKFRTILDIYDNDGLYFLIVKGERVSFDNFKRDLLPQLDALGLVIESKYGKPKAENDIPELSDVYNKDSYYWKTWAIGTKEISILVSSSGSNYNIELYIIKPSVLTEIVVKKEENKGAIAKEAGDIL